MKKESKRNYTKEYSIENKNFAKKTNFAVLKIISFSAIIIVIIMAILIGILTFVKFQKSKVSIKTIQEAWKKYDYQAVYELSKNYLQEKPFNNTALTYYSYSCFYLSQEQTDTLQAQTYLDESTLTKD